MGPYESCHCEETDIQQRLRAQTQELNLLRRELLVAQNNVEKLKQDARPFAIEKFLESDKDIGFYTGLKNYESFINLLEFLEPGTDGKNIKRNAGNLQAHEYCGRPRKLLVENELFLVLVKL